MDWKILTMSVSITIRIALSPLPALPGAGDTIPIHQNWTSNTKLRFLVDRLKRPCGEHGTSRDLIALSKHGQEAAPAVWDILPLLECPYPKVRAAALQTMSAIGRAEEVMAYLVKGLQDQAATVRESAATAIGRIGPQGKKAVPPLIEALKDQDWRVRKAAAQALGFIADPAAVPPLIQTMTEPETRPRRPGEHVRAAAAEALGKIGDKRAVKPLLHAVKYDRDIRRTAAEALKNINAPSELTKAGQTLKLSPITIEKRPK